MRGITEERLKVLFDDYQHKFLYSQLEKMYEPHAIMNILHMLVDECTELNTWQPIETAPHDRPILARIQVDYGIEIETEYHEIQWMGKKWSCYPNMPTHWQELPKDPV